MFCIDPGQPYGEYVVIGASQTEQYEPLYARIDGNQTTTRWRFSEKERQLIAEGHDLYLFIFRSGGMPLQPLNMVVDDGPLGT